MAGRKRRRTKREANGRESRTEVSEVLRAAVIEQRVRHHGLTYGQAATNDAGSVLGRLFLRGQITREQKAAGETWASLDRSYRIICGHRAPNTHAAPYEIIRGQSIEDDINEHTRDAVIARYRAAERVLMEMPKRLAAVESAALYDEEPDSLPLLVSGLDALVRIWGLTAGRRYAHVKNE